ncbi:hypothetical protein KY362_00050 [Candidatus Woesearchaeota archaeon]|nr:hypothetical protein [Candidatus Woesearchaeota archaeon]
MTLRFNSFNFISPAIEDTKKFIRPLKFRQWLKMGLISFMSAGFAGSSGRVSFPNFSIPGRGSGSGGSGAATGAAVNSTATATSGVAKVGAIASSLMYLIIPVVLMLFVIMVIWSYITSVFSFVFVECLDTRKVHIKKPFARNKGLGLSLFLFRLVLGLIILTLIAIAVVPIVLLIIAGKAQPGAVIALVLSLLLYIIIVACVMLVLGILLSLVFNFSFLHMYFARKRIWASIRATFREIWKKKLETLVFLLSRIVIGIVFSIAGALAFFAVLLVSLIILVPLGVGLFFAGKALAWSAAIITVIVILGLAVLMVFGYIMNVIMLPLSSFGIFFSIRNYKALMKR